MATRIDNSDEVFDDLLCDYDYDYDYDDLELGDEWWKE